MRSFDVVVIGGGPAGIVAASTVKRLIQRKVYALSVRVKKR